MRNTWGRIEHRSAFETLHQGSWRVTDAVTLYEPKNAKEPFVSIDLTIRKRIAILKLLTWVYVIRNPALETQQGGQGRMISELFDLFYNAGTKKNSDGRNIFPFAYREQVKRRS